MTRDGKTVVLRYLQAFCAGDLDTLEGLLAEPFTLTGPLYAFRSRADYLASLRADPPEPARFEVIRLVEEAGAVAVLYRYVKEGGALTVAQFCTVAWGHITEMHLAFDARGFGA